MCYLLTLRKEESLSENKEFNLDRFDRPWRELREKKELLRSTKKFVDEATDLFKELSRGARVFYLRGEKVATVVAGQLNKTRLAKERPDLVAKYTYAVVKEQFDETLFQLEEPDLYEQYRAQRLVLTGDTE